MLEHIFRLGDCTLKAPKYAGDGKLKSHMRAELKLSARANLRKAQEFVRFLSEMQDGAQLSVTFTPDESEGGSGAKKPAAEDPEAIAGWSGPVRVDGGDVKLGLPHSLDGEVEFSFKLCAETVAVTPILDLLRMRVDMARCDVREAKVELELVQPALPFKGDEDELAQDFLDGGVEDREVARAAADAARARGHGKGRKGTGRKGPRSTKALDPL